MLLNEKWVIEVLVGKGLATLLKLRADEKLFASARRKQYKGTEMKIRALIFCP